MTWGTQDSFNDYNYQQTEFKKIELSNFVSLLFSDCTIHYSSQRQPNISSYLHLCFCFSLLWMVLI